jgi:hypothetical protein
MDANWVANHVENPELGHDDIMWLEIMMPLFHCQLCKEAISYDVLSSLL